MCISNNPNKEKRTEDHPLINDTPLSRCNDCHFKETGIEPQSIIEMKLLKKEEMLKIDQKFIVIKERREPPPIKIEVKQEMEKESMLEAEKFE